jgi:hypothetical protein
MVKSAIPATQSPSGFICGLDAGASGRCTGVAAQALRRREELERQGLGGDAFACRVRGPGRGERADDEDRGGREHDERGDGRGHAPTRRGWRLSAWSLGHPLA